MLIPTRISPNTALFFHSVNKFVWNCMQLAIVLFGFECLKYTEPHGLACSTCAAVYALSAVSTNQAVWRLAVSRWTDSGQAVLICSGSLISRAWTCWCIHQHCITTGMNKLIYKARVDVCHEYKNQALFFIFITPFYWHTTIADSILK